MNNTEVLARLDRVIQVLDCTNDICFDDKNHLVNKHERTGRPTKSVRDELRLIRDSLLKK